MRFAVACKVLQKNNPERPIDGAISHYHHTCARTYFFFIPFAQNKLPICANKAPVCPPAQQ